MYTMQNRRVMIRAHILHNHKPHHPWSDILKYAWWFEHFAAILRNGYARFSYFKKDGSIREAKGTLCGSLIPDEDIPNQAEKPVDKKDNFEIFVYYDLNKKAWRSFRITEFIGFITAWKCVLLSKIDRGQKLKD